MKDSRKLNLGCGRLGPEFFPDYCNVDMVPHKGVDVLANVAKLPFHDNYAEEVVGSHILEHFGHFVVIEVLVEWYRVLDVDGKLYIAVPNFIEDFKRVAKYCEENGYDAEYIAYHLFGGQHGIDEKESTANAHLTGFDIKKLTRYVKEAGFQVNDCWIGWADDRKARHPSTWSRTGDGNIFLVGTK